MREFLKGLDFEDDMVDTIMAEHGKLMTKDKEQIASLKSQIEDANKEIQSYKDMDIDSIKKSAVDWETKYNELITNQKAEQEESIRKQRVSTFFDGVTFASESAKQGVMAQFENKNFQYDEESQKFQGATEWLEELKKSDSGAFKSETATPKFSTPNSAPKQNSTTDELRKAMGLK